MDYDNLTKEEQVLRLTQLAKKAVEPYNFNKPELTLIKHEMNTIFKIQTKSGESYVLRVHPQKWLGYQAINSETNFVSEIAKNTGLSVAEPVKARNGLFVQETASEGIPGTRFSVVFKWLDGTQNEKKLSKEDLILAGEYLGRLHLFCEAYIPPEGFVRPRLDTEGIFGDKGIYSPGDGKSLFSEEQKSIFNECLDIFREELDKLGEGKDQFGMVHGDYYFRNWMFNSGRMSTFDYDICGWGYYLYDIVMPYWPDNQGDKVEAYEYFRQGYSKVRRVPDGFDEYRKTFDAIRRLMEAYWIVTRRDHPQLKSYIPGILHNTACCLKDYLRKR